MSHVIMCLFFTQGLGPKRLSVLVLLMINHQHFYYYCYSNAKPRPATTTTIAVLYFASNIFLVACIKAMWMYSDITFIKQFEISNKMLHCRLCSMLEMSSPGCQLVTSHKFRLEPDSWDIIITITTTGVTNVKTFWTT